MLAGDEQLFHRVDADLEILLGFIVEIELKEEAKANFQVSVEAVKELLEACKQIDWSLA